MTVTSCTRYRPGSWVAMVSASGAWLLVDTAADHPVVERSWLSFRQTDFDADSVLEDLLNATGGASGGFAFACRTTDGTRVVVRGRAVVEIREAHGNVRVVRHEHGATGAAGTELLVPGDVAAICLSSADGSDGQSAALPLLPIGSGAVMAAAVEYGTAEHRAVENTAAAPEAGAETAEVTVAAEVASAAASTDGYLDDFMEPVFDADVERTGLVEAADLDWMNRPADPPALPEVSEPEPAPAPEPAPEAAEADELAWTTQDAQSTQHVQGTWTHPLPEPLPPSFSPTPIPTPPPLPPPFLPTPTPLQPPPPLPIAAPAFPMHPVAGDQPLVAAVRCPAGHLDAAGSQRCRVCGAGVAPQAPVTVARPSLGRLRLSNGEVYVLDRDAVFGRKPEIAVGRPGPRPNAIALTDDRDVSRNHVEIRLDGWQVFALDLGSMNGTRLAAPNTAPRLLPPMTPQEIGPGSVLTLAPDVWIYFEEEQ